MSEARIILASGSHARQQMLRNAGVSFDIKPVDLNEEEFVKDLVDPEEMARQLAKEKAMYVSKENNDAYIIGSDQVLSMDGKTYSKAKTIEEAIERLMMFQNKTHFLTSAVSVAKAGTVLWEHCQEAALTMKPMTRQDIEKYSKIADDALTSCVGCYAIEGAGARLFQSIEGDFFTILGMPLLPLLNYLDGEGALS